MRDVRQVRMRIVLVRESDDAWEVDANQARRGSLGDEAALGGHARSATRYEDLGVYAQTGEGTTNAVLYRDVVGQAEYRAVAGFELLSNVVDEMA